MRLERHPTEGAALFRQRFLLVKMEEKWTARPDENENSGIRSLQTSQTKGLCTETGLNNPNDGQIERDEDMKSRKSSIVAANWSE